MMSMASFFALFLICTRELNLVYLSTGISQVSSPVYVGVRQGENLSPVLFALFLNDLESFMHSNNCSDVNLELDSDNLYIYLQLFVLLYADDTVIFGADETSFQKNLDMFYEYAKMWQLDINYDKTKIFIFGTLNDDHFDFKMGNMYQYVKNSNTWG